MRKYIREYITGRTIAFLDGKYVQKVIGFGDNRIIEVDESAGFVYIDRRPVVRIEYGRIYSVERFRDVALIEDNIVRDIDNQFERYEVDEGCTELEKAALFICAHNY